MRVALIIAVIIFLTCCLVGIVCYYLYKKDILHIGERCIDKYYEQEQEHKMNQVIIKDRMAYMTYEIYGQLKNLSDTEQLKFRDAISGMPIQVIPDSYFG